MDSFIELLTSWGYVGMLVSAFIAGSFLPFSSEAVLLACIGLGLDPVMSVLFSLAGNVLGGLTCFYIGRLGKMEWVERYLRVKKRDMDRAERFVKGRGPWMAFFAFLPIIGTAILIVLGLMRANVIAVVAAMTTGKLLRYSLLAAGAVGLFG